MLKYSEDLMETEDIFIRGRCSDKGWPVVDTK